MASARNFAIDLDRFGQVTRAQATTIFRKVALELDSRVVLSTPVDTGRARANWFPSIGTQSGAVDLAATDKTGGRSISAIQTRVLEAPLGATVWLTNNLDYILELENGKSTQAPSGMVDLNILASAAHYGGTVRRL